MAYTREYLESLIERFISGIKKIKCGESTISSVQDRLSDGNIKSIKWRLDDHFEKYYPRGAASELPEEGEKELEVFKSTVEFVEDFNEAIVVFPELKSESNIPFAQDFIALLRIYLYRIGLGLPELRKKFDAAVSKLQPSGVKQTIETLGKVRCS